MTTKQKLLRLVYPLFMRLNRWAGKAQIISNENKVNPPVSFYTLSTIVNNGDVLDFGTLKGKHVLLVNTASDCGYTAQYNELQQLYTSLKDQLVIIAFPSNDFKEQERGNDKDIAGFCKLNFGITFPIAQKSFVVKSKFQHQVYQWLSNKEKNGWNNQQPVWNFNKYLVNDQGVLTHFLSPAVSPSVVKELLKK